MIEDFDLHSTEFISMMQDVGDIYVSLQPTVSQSVRNYNVIVVM